MGYRLTPSFSRKALRRRITAFTLAVFLAAQCFFPAFFPSAALAWGEFTHKDEAELGKKFSVLIKSRLPLVHDPEVTRYVEAIVKRLSAGLPAQPFPFSISVIRHPSINAFATPGGYLFINTGLILAMEHESELASVVAHEMAHVTQRHIARRIESSQMISLLSVIGALAGAFLGGDAGAAAVTGSMAAGQAAMLKYSREDESEADQVGMNFLKKAGYSPEGMVGAFQKMSRKQWTMGTSMPAYLSTHPGLQDRIKDMSARIGVTPGKPQKVRAEDAKFFRIQTLVRARYSDPAGATVFFSKQTGGDNRCMALMGLGILAARQNNVTDAATRFEEALACAPSDELVIREAGRFHYTKGNKNRSMELLSKAVSMDRNDLMALFFYARGLADSGQTSQALVHMKDLLRKVPEDSEVHAFIARYYGQSGDLFNANMHMAYSHLYVNEKRKVEQFFQKAKGLAKTSAQRSQVERFEREYNERKAFW